MPARIEHRTEEGVELKRCSRCEGWKSLDNYTVETRRADGLHYNCKQCLAEYRHERLEHDKAYRKANRDKVNKWDKNSRDRKKANPDDVYIQRRIRENVARRMRHLLHGQKSQHTVELLGCSADFLKSHLEGTWSEGMSWDNYGVWHIDHRIPCAAFDQSDPTERAACWNYRNLQAMWGAENLSKSNEFSTSEKESYLRLFVNQILVAKVNG